MLPAFGRQCLSLAHHPYRIAHLRVLLHQRAILLKREERPPLLCQITFPDAFLALLGAKLIALHPEQHMSAAVWQAAQVYSGTVLVSSTPWARAISASWPAATVPRSQSATRAVSRSHDNAFTKAIAFGCTIHDPTSSLPLPASIS